jgi:hypothetical protein
MYGVSGDQTDDPVTNKIELRANKVPHLRNNAEPVDCSLAQLQ